jgi:hypothetical protein
MHTSKPYGHLVVNGIAPTLAQIATMCGSTEDEVSRLVLELEKAGVYSRNKAKTIYSRRMVRDEQKRIDGESSQKKQRIIKDAVPAKPVENKDENHEPHGCALGSGVEDLATQILEDRKKERIGGIIPTVKISEPSRASAREGEISLPEQYAKFDYAAAGHGAFNENDPVELPPKMRGDLDAEAALVAVNRFLSYRRQYWPDSDRGPRRATTAQLIEQATRWNELPIEILDSVLGRVMTGRISKPGRLGEPPSHFGFANVSLDAALDRHKNGPPFQSYGSGPNYMDAARTGYQNLLKAQDDI